MPFFIKLGYFLDLAVLGMVIYSGLHGNVGVAVAGLGVYAAANVLDNIALDLAASK